MQSSAKILLPIGAVAVLGLGAMVVFEPNLAEAQARPIPAAAAPEIPVPAAEDDNAEVLTAQGNSEMEMTPRVDAPPLIRPGSNTGMISGRVAISTRVIEKLRRYTIVVQEDINTNGLTAKDPQPFFRMETFKADLSRGTPYFDFLDIPFSAHPYKVTIVAEGINGSSGHVHINARHPRGKDGDVQLSLTPGTYYSIVLRDQRQVPRADLPVRMIPIGEGFVRRDTQIGRTDQRGYVLFENVVKGDYRIVIGAPEAPLAPPKDVQVFAAFTSFSASGRPQTQGTSILVPDGEHVTLEILNKVGYGVENAKVKIWQIEVRQYHEFKATTDRAGHCMIENVPYGKYQLNIQSPHNGIKDVRFEVVKDQPAPKVEVTMPR